MLLKFSHKKYWESLSLYAALFIFSLLEVTSLIAALQGQVVIQFEGYKIAAKQERLLPCQTSVVTFHFKLKHVAQLYPFSRLFRESWVRRPNPELGLGLVDTE